MNKNLDKILKKLEKGRINFSDISRMLDYVHMDETNTHTGNVLIAIDEMKDYLVKEMKKENADD